MRKILLALGGLCVVAASFIGALVAMERLWPRPIQSVAMPHAICGGSTARGRSGIAGAAWS